MVGEARQQLLVVHPDDGRQARVGHDVPPVLRLGVEHDAHEPAVGLRLPHLVLPVCNRRRRPCGCGTRRRRRRGHAGGRSCHPVSPLEDVHQRADGAAQPWGDGVEDSCEGLGLVSKGPISARRDVCPLMHEYKVHPGPLVVKAERGYVVHQRASHGNMR